MATSNVGILPTFEVPSKQVDLLFFIFAGDGDRLKDTDADRRTRGQRGGVAIAGSHRGRPRSRSGRRANRHPLAAAENGAEDRAADRRTADFRLAARRVAFTEDRVG